MLKHTHIYLLLAFLLGSFHSLYSQVDFTASVTQGCSPQVIVFTPNAPGATSYDWDLGNGTNSNAVSPGVTYINPGFYMVRMRAIYPGGGTREITKTSYIEIFDNPIADFSASPIQICEGESVHFTDQSQPGSNPITSWLWDFGDGDTGSVQNVNHTYTSPGTYSVSLIATDVRGCEDTFVQIQWSPLPDIPYARELIIEKDAGNGYPPVYRQAASDPTLNWTDESVKVHDQSYRYRAYVTDSCGEQTPIGRIARSIYLEASRQVGNVFFNWNPYEEWLGGIRNYRLEVFNEATQNFEPVSDIGASFTEFIDRETDLSQREYCYRLLADESSGKELTSVSNIVCVPIGPQIFYPNAFTPNGDQHNERFTITSLFVEEARIMIFNRWGEKLFESTDLNTGWDGLYKGKPVQEGVYVFRVEGVGYDGTLFSQAGTVTLIR